VSLALAPQAMHTCCTCIIDHNLDDIRIQGLLVKLHLIFSRRDNRSNRSNPLHHISRYDLLQLVCQANQPMVLADSFLFDDIFASSPKSMSSFVDGVPPSSSTRTVRNPACFVLRSRARHAPKHTTTSCSFQSPAP
jgi:hypothetical protein